MYTSMHRGSTMGGTLSRSHASYPAHPKRPCSPGMTQRADPKRYRPTACVFASCIAHPRPPQRIRSRVHARQPQEPRKTTHAAVGLTRARSASQRSIRALWGGLRTARRHEQHQDLRGCSSARRQLPVVLGLTSTVSSRSRP